MAASRAATRRFDLADIVRDHRARLEAAVHLRPEQKRALSAIAMCRTSALGGHLDLCTRCGYEHPAYNSCRNRHCPKCQALAQEKWIEGQRARMLDAPHFHVVFTLPAELRPLAAFARSRVFDMLFRTAWATLATFAESRLSGTVGALLVLHTWTRKLEFHPHIHAIVTGGALSLDDTAWCPAQRAFLFPVKAMSRIFSAKMLAALRCAYRDGHFDGFDDFSDPEGFARLSRSIAKLSWHVYAKPTFSRGAHVLEYLGRYTHRVGLANSRILDVTSDAITFRTKGAGTTTVSPLTFLRRFVQHVLLPGFHKIRSFGLYASRPRRTKANALLGGRKRLRRPRRSWHERLRALTGRDVTRCPHCGDNLAQRAIPCARAPPGAPS